MRQTRREPYGYLSQREVYNVIPELTTVTTEEVTIRCYTRYGENLRPRPEEYREIANRVKRHLRRLELKGLVEPSDGRGWRRRD